MKLLMELASVSKKLNQHQPWFPEGNEVEPASWLSNLLAGAKIYWMLHPKMHPYGKPDAETRQWWRPNWKEDGSPRRASQHFRKSLKSPWGERRQTRGSYKQRAEWTSNEIILKSWQDGQDGRDGEDMSG